MHWSECQDAWVLTRAELRAQVRRIAGSRRQLAGVAVGVLSFGLFVPLLFNEQLRAFGGAFATGDLPVGQFGTLLGGGLATGLYFGIATVLNQSRVGRVGPLVRTSIPPNAVVIGRLMSEVSQAMAFAVVPGVIGLALVTIGAGSPLPALAVVVATLPLLVAGTVVGRAVGAAIRYVGLLSRLSAWSKVVVLVVATGAIFVAYQTAVPVLFGDVDGPTLSAVVPGAPLQAYATIAAVPFGTRPRLLGVAVFGGILATLVAGLAATVRLEQALLFDDRMDQGASGAAVSRDLPRVFAATASTRVAWRYLLRTRRNPMLVSHLSMVLFGVLAFAGSLVAQPDLLTAMGPGTAIVVGSVLAGATYCLNPMGDDRDQLALLLTSTASTKHLLRGRAIAGIVIGSVVAVGVAVPLGIVADPPLRVLGRAVLTPIVLLGAAGTALGIGAVVPKFERSEYMNVERAHPSMLGMLGYFFGTAGVVAVGLGLVWLTVDRGPGVLLLGGWVVYLAVVGATGIGGYVYARRRFDRLGLDDV